MDSCHYHLAVITFLIEAPCICPACKLVQVVSHATQVPHMGGMFLRQPSLHMTISETLPHVFA